MANNGKNNKNKKKSNNKSNKNKYEKYGKKAEKVIDRSPVWVIVVAIILATLIALFFILNKFVFELDFKQIFNQIFNSQSENDMMDGGTDDDTGSGVEVTIDGELSFHFLTLGNKSSGDCTYIKAGDKDILIDAGSEKSSLPTIKGYVNNYVTDGKLEYVIVTHADKDHIVGFGSDDGILDSYECETIIDFPKTNKSTKIYNSYLQKRELEVQNGAKHYTALECYNNENGASREIQLTESVSMEILYNYYYDHSTSNENDYSVCVMFKHGDRKFLFTGDLEKSGEEKLAEFYDFSQVELFKAGHHGSKTASNDVLLQEIKPKIFVASCVAGYSEFSQTSALDYFPSQRVIDSVKKYTSKIYVTSLGVDDGDGNVTRQDLNGNVVVVSNETGVEVQCSASSRSLLESDWYLANRAS